MPLTRMKELDQKQKQQVKALQDLLAKNDFVLSLKFRKSVMAHMYVIAETAHRIGEERSS